MSAAPAGSEVTYRRMVLDDVSEVHEIDMLSFSLPWPEQSFRYEVAENKASRCWVAEVEKEGKRRIAAMLCQWLIVDEVHVGTFAVLPEFRQKGIGRRLMAKGLLEAYDEGVQQFYLEVRRSNTIAQKMYRQFGFEVIDVRPHYYSDNHEDALIMLLSKPDRDRLEQQFTKP